VRFASGWVAQQFFLQLRVQRILNIVSFILTCRGDVETSASRGYWFETISHMMLSSGGDFKCRMLDSSHEFVLTLPQADIYSFKTPKDASSKLKDDLSVYCLPTNCNQVAIDAMSSPYLLFQMASGPKHSINSWVSKAGML
jgi:hypothetical protein